MRCEIISNHCAARVHRGDAVVQIEFNNRVAIIHGVGVGWRNGIKGAISSGGKDSPVGLSCRNIGGEAGARHPDSAGGCTWSSAPCTGSLQSRSVVGKNPTMPGTIVTVRPKGDIDDLI